MHRDVGLRVAGTAEKQSRTPEIENFLSLSTM